ncbi:DUF4245 family protein [Nocardioides sp. W3-2-3]|uniref:DUF4245 family protein n=1 Tax=Nocardioides convexus TaxID=2712224 RepID=UPI0024182CA1|nr:DUF4245 family protein [Nocardioides convexus]NHA01625.1 DUF4245 family protein [Nocardioides convexus]
MSSQPVEPAGKPGRYQRSAAGLITSLVVTVLAIAGLLYFMGAFRPDFEAKPEAIDYLETVQSAQQAGLHPAYPPSLPKGWIATGVDVTVEEPQVFMLRMLTDDDRFAAVRLEKASVGALLAAWVDEDTATADAYTVPASVKSPVARTWKGYTDDGGDTAYAAEVDGGTVLVFGSAPAGDLRTIVDSLVTTPVPKPAKK